MSTSVRNSAAMMAALVLAGPTLADPDAKYPSAARQDYVHDCLDQSVSKITTNITGPLLYVTQQSEKGDLLKVIEAENALLGYCRPKTPKKDEKGPATEDVSVDLLAPNAVGRRGYVYGGLVVPYKAYAGGKFVTQGLQVMPYIGFRNSWAGGGASTIAAFGIGKVTLDGDAGNATTEGKSEQGNAFSLALGQVFSIEKQNSMRFGYLLGYDVAERKAGYHFAQRGKPWVALQVGLDFTD